MVSAEELDPKGAKELAGRLLAAERDAAPIGPLSKESPQLTIEDAYAVQLAGRELRLADGAQIVGRKVGLTSGAMQDMLGVRQPDFGYLLDSMVRLAGGRSAKVPSAELIQPRVEAEIAFVLGADLAGPEVTATEVLNAASGVAPAIEVIDSRIADWEITIVDTIADNASCGIAVVGPPMPLEAHFELGSIQMQMDCDGDRVTGHGRDVLGHPANAVAWLVNVLAGFGEGLSAGDVVLPGALARALPVRAGSCVIADFEQLGQIEVNFG